MIIKKWEDLPDKLKNTDVRKYHEYLSQKKGSLVIKRLFDIVLSAVLLVLLSPVMLLLALMIKIDSPGNVFFKQIRITQYGREFYIYKFRTMIQDADKVGAKVTILNDNRITKIGNLIRKCRLDELPQLINVLKGEMTFVGTRPEVKKYVEAYNNEMLATLLLPAGITSRCSVEYKDEDELLSDSKDVDKTYIEVILPEKMKINLNSLLKFSLLEEIKIMFATVKAVL